MAAMQDLPKRSGCASNGICSSASTTLLHAAQAAAVKGATRARRKDDAGITPRPIVPALPLLITLGLHSKSTHLTRHSKYHSRVGYTRFKAGIGSSVSALSTMIAGALVCWYSMELMFDAHYAVQTDGCGAQTYSVFEQMGGGDWIRCTRAARGWRVLSGIRRPSFWRFRERTGRRAGASPEQHRRGSRRVHRASMPEVAQIASTTWRRK